MCLSVRNHNENVKVFEALKPKGCPPINKFHSKIFHYGDKIKPLCTQDPRFIPTDEAFKTLKCKGLQDVKYNVPNQGPKMKILNNDRRNPNCCGMNYFKSCFGSGNDPPPLLVCQDCGCGYTPKITEFPCKSNNCFDPQTMSVRINCSQQMNAKNKAGLNNVIYFRVDPSGNCELEKPAAMKPELQLKNPCPCSNCRTDFGNGDHFKDCRCQMCQNRRANCCNPPPLNLPDWSNQIWFANVLDTKSTECPEPPAPTVQMHSNFNSWLRRIHRESCQKVMRPGRCGKRQAVPCNFSFVSDPGCGTGIGVNRNCRKKHKKTCGCFYCQTFRQGKSALHGACCDCQLCETLRQDSRSRPHHYNSQRINGCTNLDSRTGGNCCRHGPLCTCPANYMKPIPLSPQEELMKERAERAAIKAGRYHRGSDPNSKDKDAACDGDSCPCHQYTPSNWVRKMSCDKSTPTDSCTKKQAGDTEIGGFCPPTFVRPMNEGVECCDNVSSADCN